MKARQERALDEYLGFSAKLSERGGEEAKPAPDDDGDDNGAYVDAWYRVLKARVKSDSAER